MQRSLDDLWWLAGFMSQLSRCDQRTEPRIGVHNSDAHREGLTERYALQAFVSGPSRSDKRPLGVAPLPHRPAATADGSSQPNENLGFWHPERVHLGSPIKTWRKVVPLLLMFFCILFNYTILRDTKVRRSVRLFSTKRDHQRGTGTRYTAVKRSTGFEGWLAC